MYVRPNPGLRGLGAVSDLPTFLDGSPYHCEYALNWAAYPPCWKYSTSAWAQILQFGLPGSNVIAPPPAVPAAYGTVAAPYDCAANPAGSPSCPGYDAAVSASIAAGAAQTKANESAFFASQPSVGPGCTGQYQDENGNWICPTSTGTNWLLYAGLAAAAFGVLAVMR